MTQEVEGLDAAAAAEIQGCGDRVARSESGQGQPRPADAQHVVGGELAAGDELAEIGGDPPAHVAGVVADLVGAQVDCGAHDGGIGGGDVGGDGRRRARTGRGRARGAADAGTGGLRARRTGGPLSLRVHYGVAVDGHDEAHGEGARGAGASQHGVEVGGRDGLAEHEQSGQNGGGARGGAGGAVLSEHCAHRPEGRQAKLVVQGVVGDGPQEVAGGVHTPAGGLEVRAQRLDLIGRGRGGRRSRAGGGR